MLIFLSKNEYILDKYISYLNLREKYIFKSKVFVFLSGMKIYYIHIHHLGFKEILINSLYIDIIYIN